MEVATGKTNVGLPLIVGMYGFLDFYHRDAAPPTPTRTCAGVLLLCTGAQNEGRLRKITFAFLHFLLVPLRSQMWVSGLDLDAEEKGQVWWDPTTKKSR